jgi:hypothetical protein
MFPWATVLPYLDPATLTYQSINPLLEVVSRI